MKTSARALKIILMENQYLTGEYVDKNPTYHVEDSPWKAAQVLRMVRKHGLRPASICEIGCGAGEILRQLQIQLPKGTQLFGYEISPQAIELCRSRENDALRFLHQDLLATHDGPFDLLLCMDVFEHVSDYLGFLRQLRSKAGLKLFHIPLDISVLSVLRTTPITGSRASAGHLHYFTKETALLTLQDAGYEVLDWYYTPGAIARGKGLRTRLAKRPRQLLSLVNPDWAARLLGGFSILALTK